MKTGINDLKCNNAEPMQHTLPSRAEQQVFATTGGRGESWYICPQTLLMITDWNSTGDDEANIYRFTFLDFDSWECWVSRLSVLHMFR